MYKKLCNHTMASMKRLSVDNEEVLNQEVIADDNYYRQKTSNNPLSPVRRKSPGPKTPENNSSKQMVIPGNTTQDPNWQASCKSLKERNAGMFNNHLMADVYFKVGQCPNTQRIPAHKYILATSSSVFYAMFYGGLSDCSQEVEIPDIEPVALLNLLRFMYTDEVHLEPDTVLATLYAATKYIVPHLAKQCVAYLETSLNARNACILLSQSRLFEETDLMQRCWEVLDAQAEEALLSEGFTEMDYETLNAVLERESLNVNEVSVFQAVVRWAEAECARRDIDPTPENKRTVLGNALYKIRIPTMHLDEFANTAAQNPILTLEEKHSLFLYYTAQNKPQLQFSCRRRAGLTKQYCLRFQSCAYRSNQWRYRGRCDSIQFCVDRRIFLAGFGLYGSSNSEADYKVMIELKRNGVRLAQRNLKFQSDGTNNIFPVHFEYPIQIDPDLFYTVSATLEGSELSFFGQEGMSEKTVGHVTFQFQCSSDSTNGTGVQGGQIPQLIFYS